MTALGDFSSGDVLTAADLNAIGTWTTYTATPTNFTASSQACSYAQINDVVFVRFYFIVTAITGAPSFTTPPGFNINQFPQTQTGNFLDAGTANYPAIIFYNSSTSVSLFSFYSGGAYLQLGGVSSSVPFTWTSGDVIEGGFWYRT